MARAPRPRPGVVPSVIGDADAEKRRLKGRIAKGNAIDAAARVLVYVGKAQRRVEIELELVRQEGRVLLDGLHVAHCRPPFRRESRDPSAHRLNLRRAQGWQRHLR